MKFSSDTVPVSWRRALPKLEKLITRRLKLGGVVSLALVPESDMRRLNRIYRGKDKPTDVLSFSFIDARKKVASSAAMPLGEVLLCMPVLRKKARERGRTLVQEFQALTIHGILHILGYDHVRPRGIRRMERLEESLLNELAKR